MKTNYFCSILFYLNISVNRTQKIPESVLRFFFCFLCCFNTILKPHQIQMHLLLLLAPVFILHIWVNHSSCTSQPMGHISHLQNLFYLFIYLLRKFMHFMHQSRFCQYWKQVSTLEVGLNWVGLRQLLREACKKIGFDPPHPPQNVNFLRKKI